MPTCRWPSSVRSPRPRLICSAWSWRRPKVIDREAQADDWAEFVSQVASGELKTLKAIRERAIELDY